MEKRGNSHLHSLDKLNLIPLSKHAQLTVFIILAIIVVGVIGIAFMMFGGSDDSGLDRSLFSKWFMKTDVNTLKDAISDCMTANSRQALKVVGLQGGFYHKPNESYQMDWAFIPYYYVQGSFYFPTKEKVESEIASYIDDKFVECMNELDKKNLQVDYSKSKSSVKLSKSRATITIDMPVTIKKGSEANIIDLKRKPLVFNSSLNEIYEIAEYITNSHKENAESICINCVLNMAKDRNLYVDMINFPYDKSTTLIMISENRTYVEPYVFEFLNKY